MEKRKLGNTGYEISPVIYGGIVSMKDGQASSDQYVAWAIEHGINYFDIAPSYGDAQEKLGNSLRPYRGKVYLACKTAQRHANEAGQELRESMRLLHTDYFDNYQLHGLASLDEVEQAFSSDGIMKLIVPLKQQGVLRKLGITCHSEAAALRAIELYDFDTVLFPFNWHMNIGSGYGSALMKAAKERGMGILGMKSLIERAWQSPEEQARYPFPKSWCKPIDLENEALRVAAVKYAFTLGVDAIVPPGDFINFSFAVNHIEECLKPLSTEERNLLDAAYQSVKNRPPFVCSDDGSVSCMSL